MFGPTSRLGETALVGAARRGEEDAFEKIFLLHKDRVFSICLRMTGSHFDAEDLLQESFVLAFKNIAGFRGDSSFSTWLYRITVNVVVDFLRKRHPRLIMAAGEPLEHEIAIHPIRDRGRDWTLERLRLEHAIARLPPGYRSVLVLHDVEGYNHEEIAQCVGTSTGTSKSQLHKARKRLRELLTQR